MISSMTGFARRESRLPEGRLECECRSINHRYLELSIKCPEEFRHFEGEIRDCVNRHLKRGKVDLYLRFNREEAEQRQLEVDETLARQLADAAERVAELVSRPAPIDTVQLLRWPGLVKEVAPASETIRDASLELLEQTLRETAEARAQEGTRIATMLHERVQQVREIITQVQQRLPEVRAHIMEKVRARLNELDVPADSGRLEQEIAIVAQRLDVDEELDRLGSHCEQLTEIIGADEPVGRRMDFLMQEFNREANTLGSKSQDTATTRAALELKVLIEQMREQIQNVE